jgi:hypothetical protein
MLRVEALAAMLNYAQATKLFRDEIPGALPLQWHFYQVINSPQWLPHLLKQQLIIEPLVTDEATTPRRFGEWPVGHYLLKVAKSGDPSAGPLVSEAIRTIAGSKHPDVRRQSLEIIAALPPDDADQLVDVAIGWLDADTRNFYQTAAQHLLKRLAEGRYIQSAFKVAAAIFQLFEQGGEIITTHPQHMYEHHLPEAVMVLAAKDGLATVRLFSQLLHQAITITRRVAHEEDHDYTYSTPHSLAGNEMAQYGIYEALIIAVRDAALIACKNNPASTADVIAYLNSYHLKIFGRLALHVLSKNAGASPALATAILSDPELIGESWCEDEYAELAVAHFSELTSDEQERIFLTIDALPDQFRDVWRENFTAHEKVQPNTENEQHYELAVLRDAMWKWQDALPPSRKRLIDEIVAAIGRPDAWRERLFPSEVSPLTGADFSTKPIPAILEFLRSWEPSDEPVRQTITALGQQLRGAVEQEPARFAEFANQFGDVRPIYVRRLLEGFDSKARNNEKLAWPRILELMRVVMERLKQPANTFPAADGDDTDWLWCAFAAATVLKSGLRQGDAGIAYEHASDVESIIRTLFDSAPRKPSANDFEKTFKEHPYFAAEQSLWGSSIDLCILFIWWNSKHPASVVAREPRSALLHMPHITGMLERALADITEWGSIPRAILGRYLSSLGYFGKDWLMAHAAVIFPDDDAALRRAAWLGHLLNDSGPAIPLVPQLTKSYLEAIEALGSENGAHEKEIRENRLGDYLLVLFLADAVSDSMMQAFWQHATVRVRAHVIGFLGRELQLSPVKLTDAWRARGRIYWEMRLSAAIASDHRDDFRRELGAISQWFAHTAHTGIDPIWLLDQLLRMMKAGFAPNNGYGIMKWLGAEAPSQPDKAVELLSLLINNPNLEIWTFTTERASIRAVLENGLQMGNNETTERARDVVNYLATVAETSYLDLLKAAPVQPNQGRP